MQRRRAWRRIPVGRRLRIRGVAGVIRRRGGRVVGMAWLRASRVVRSRVLVRRTLPGRFPLVPLICRRLAALKVLGLLVHRLWRTTLLTARDGAISHLSVTQLEFALLTLPLRHVARFFVFERTTWSFWIVFCRWWVFFSSTIHTLGRTWAAHIDVSRRGRSAAEGLGLAVGSRRHGRGHPGLLLSRLVGCAHRRRSALAITLRCAISLHFGRAVHCLWRRCGIRTDARISSIVRSLIGSVRSAEGRVVGVMQARRGVHGWAVTRSMAPGGRARRRIWRRGFPGRRRWSSKHGRY